MKRLVLFLPGVLLLSGCAQVFQGNAFQSIDQPPPLSASALASQSDSTIVTRITTDTSFLTSLKSNPDALAAVQGVLSTGYKTTGATSTTVITDAQAYVTATTGASSAGPVVTSAINQISTLSGGATSSSAASAMTSIFAGQSAAQIEATLTQFQNMSDAFSHMQTAATSGNTVSSTTFYGNSPSKLNLAVTATLAASCDAFVADTPGGISVLAAQLAAGTTPTGGANVTTLTDALSGTGTDPSTNKYAYLSTVKPLVNP